MELEVVSAKFDDNLKSYYFNPRGEKYLINDKIL